MLDETVDGWPEAQPALRRACVRLMNPELLNRLSLLRFSNSHILRSSSLPSLVHSTSSTRIIACKVCEREGSVTDAPEPNNHWRPNPSVNPVSTFKLCFAETPKTDVRFGVTVNNPPACRFAGFVLPPDVLGLPSTTVGSMTVACFDITDNSQRAADNKGSGPSAFKLKKASQLPSRNQTA